MLEKVFHESDSVVTKLKGDELGKDYLDKNGFSRPILVEDKRGLNIRVPDADDLKINDIVELVGRDYKLDVIDVERQEIVNMTIDDLKMYFDSKNRSKVYNLLSLEISQTK